MVQTKGRLTARSTKTEHRTGDHAVRVVPICPELRLMLAEAFERAEPGESLIVPMVARTTVNLRTPFERIITKAGHEPWPRLFQNLRTSCETDCVEKYPPHVVAEWLGHSPKVAAQHYLISREHHFEHVVNGGAATAATSTETPADGPPPCDADCSALATHLATQQGSARESAPSHETTEPAATAWVTVGSSEVTPVTRTHPRQEAAQQKAALPRDGRAAVTAAGCRAKISPPGPWMARRA